MTDQAVIGSNPNGTTFVTGGHGYHHDKTHVVTEAIGNAASHLLNAEHVTQKSIGDATHHLLNAEQITQKAIADSIQTTLLDNAHLKNQLNLDGNATRSEVKFEGRNLDNKVCMVERHIADVRQEIAKEFCDTNSLIQENKFELTKQNSELKLLTIEQGEKTRTLIYEQQLAELRGRLACCCPKHV